MDPLSITALIVGVVSPLKSFLHPLQNRNDIPRDIRALVARLNTATERLVQLTGEEYGTRSGDSSDLLRDEASKQAVSNTCRR